MEHKAFLFDFSTFEQELRGMLEDALVSRDTSGLVSFINANVGHLRDPYEGEPLGPDWESLIETQDPHQYGDFALTKYYDPLGDIGLGALWVRVQELVVKNCASTESPILGGTVGLKGDPFDHGKMGSYFQTSRQVRQNHRSVSELAKDQPSDDLNKAVQMLEEAVQRDTGLYITF